MSQYLLQNFSVGVHFGTTKLVCLPEASRVAKASSHRHCHIFYVDGLEESPAVPKKRNYRQKAADLVQCVQKRILGPEQYAGADNRCTNECLLYLQFASRASANVG